MLQNFFDRILAIMRDIDQTKAVCSGFTNSYAPILFTPNVLQEQALHSVQCSGELALFIRGQLHDDSPVLPYPQRKPHAASYYAIKLKRFRFRTFALALMVTKGNRQVQKFVQKDQLPSCLLWQLKFYNKILQKSIFRDWRFRR